MRERGDNQKWWLAVAFLVGAFLVLVVSMQGCPKAQAYRGIYALTDTVSFIGAVTDTSGEVGATPTAFEAFYYKAGVVFDSSTVWWELGPGVWKARHLASDGSTAGDYQAIFKVTIQGMDLVGSDCWTAGGTTLTTAERAAVADAAADSTLLYRIGAALDSGVYDTTLGGRLYDLDTQNATGAWASITQEDCDTVKMGGLPLADAAVIVTLTADKSTPVYWGRTDANGCFTVYVRKGATYAVRPVYQGSWMASWCEVSK